MAYMTVSIHAIMVTIIPAYLLAKERKRTYAKRLEAGRK